MKKILAISILVLTVALMAVGPASAQKGKVNINGQVTAIGDGTLAVLSKKGETFVVTVPEGFDLTSIQVGDSVLIKAVAGEDGSWLALSIKQIGPGSAGNDLDESQAEGNKYNSAYCANGRQEKPHPLAAKLAQRYGVDEEWVMDYFCEGYGMGAIMLAIKTSEIEGNAISPDTFLAERATGKGWGQIWQEQGLIGKDRDGHSPPGLLKKPDNAGPKNKN